jgi:hypothetical protein
MPHANDPERFERIRKQMQSVHAVTLSEYQGGEAKPIDDIQFPPVGTTNADVFGNNLLEVMQFVFNHTTFDAENELDNAILATYRPLGVVPGRTFDAAGATPLDGARLREAVARIERTEMARATEAGFKEKSLFSLFQPKGKMTLEFLLFQSVIGPIGLPASEAIYPAIATMDGEPMNAMNDYVIAMSQDELPPAGAFWSFTLYDTQNGFFIPNEQKKYSVGENGGMQLDESGGIEIHITAEKPGNVPEENWLPIVRKDEDIDVVLRIYVPDLERMKTWNAPEAERVETRRSSR